MCLAHVTNTMATRAEDFEKGGETGLEEALKVCELALEAALEHAAARRRNEIHSVSRTQKTEVRDHERSSF